MKKRLLAAVFAAFIAASLTACGDDAEGSTTPDNGAVKQDTTPSEPAEPPKPAEPAKSADSGTLGAYDVSIGDCAFGTDYEGNKMIVISYDFTNNSEETKAPDLTVYAKAFQDGIELERAYSDDAIYNAETATKEIRPGTTLQNCQVAFVLTSTSPVEFEISELMSFSDDKLYREFEVQ